MRPCESSIPPIIPRDAPPSRVLERNFVPYCTGLPTPVKSEAKGGYLARWRSQQTPRLPASGRDKGTDHRPASYTAACCLCQFYPVYLAKGRYLLKSVLSLSFAPSSKYTLLFLLFRFSVTKRSVFIFRLCHDRKKVHGILIPASTVGPDLVYPLQNKGI